MRRLSLNDRLLVVALSRLRSAFRAENGPARGNSTQFPGLYRHSHRHFPQIALVLTHLRRGNGCAATGFGRRRSIQLLQIARHTDQRPLLPDLLLAAQQKTVEPRRALDLAEHRLDRRRPLAVSFSTSRRFQLCPHSVGERHWCEVHDEAAAPDGLTIVLPIGNRVCRLRRLGDGLRGAGSIRRHQQFDVF
jgi:hypothetical protein